MMGLQPEAGEELSVREEEGEEEVTGCRAALEVGWREMVVSGSAAVINSILC